MLAKNFWSLIAALGCSIAPGPSAVSHGDAVSFMIYLRCLSCLFAFTALSLAAEPEFPGLKAIMSEAAWKKAKLDQLSADNVRLIDEAFAQYLKQGERPIAVTPSPQGTEANLVSSAPVAKKRSRWERFGLAADEEKAALKAPMMTAKVLAWHGTNGVVLDNGQIWDGIDLIRDELVGQEVGISEGRFGSFLLIVDGKDTSVRMRRIK